MRSHDERFVIEKCDFFSTVQLWPRHTKINPTEWLTNFSEDDKVFALHLLNFFMYFSNELIDEMFYSGIHNISNHIRKQNKTNPREAWDKFVDSAYITMVTGEKQNISDSGHLFARKARDFAGFREGRLKEPKEIAENYDIKNCSLLFVDDFIGSGSQIHNTLVREYYGVQFEEILKQKNITPIYCPLLCTDTGLRLVEQRHKSLTVLPVHILDKRYSVFGKHSLCWSGKMRIDGINFLNRVSKQIGLPTKKKYTNCWRGYQGLGLAIGFDHCVPDATLPIFTTTNNGWIPLIRIRRDDQI